MCPPPLPSEWKWEHRSDKEWFYRYLPGEDSAKEDDLELVLAVTRTPFDAVANHVLLTIPGLVSLVQSYVPFIDYVTSIQSNKYQLTVIPQLVSVDTNVLASCLITIWDPIPAKGRSGDYVGDKKETAELMHLRVEDEEGMMTTKCYFLNDATFDPRRLIRIRYDMYRLGDETAKTLLSQFQELF
jgi:hypothetical protein